MPFLSSIVDCAMRMPAVSPVTALVGGRRDRLDVFRRSGGRFLRGLDGFGDLFRDGDFFRAWRRLGLFFGDDRGGAWRLRGEDAGVEGALRGGQRDRGDHGGLDGSDVRGVFAPVDAAVMEEKRPANDGSSDQTVQHERAGEVGAEPVAVAVVFGAELEVSGYGTLLTFAAAG